MISKLLTTEQAVEVRHLFDETSHIAVLTHMSPDGDAMGSALGLRNWMIENISSTNISVIVPNQFPSFLSWIPGADEVIIFEQQPELATSLINKADLIICTDFNEPKRIGALGELLVSRLETGTKCIVIDHHIVVPEKSIVDKALSFVDSSSPSASELVYRMLTDIICVNGDNEIHLDSATALYTGMMTDTGNFSFNSNHAEMYEIIAKLVEMGVNKDACYNAVFNQYSADRMRLMGYCLYQKMRIFPEYHLAFVYLSRHELYRFHFQSGDAEGIVNLPLQIGDVYYSCFMREDKVSPSEEALAGGSKIKVKISMRSQGNRPVNTFCHEVFGGGGHMNASGGEFYGNIKDAAQLFLDAYPKYCLKE